MNRREHNRLVRLFCRWLCFNAVGALGVGIQLGMLGLLSGFFGVGYLPATALAVETSVLHNFLWHEHWTWRDHTRRNPRGLPWRLLQFNAAAGGISLVGNLALMRLLVGGLGLHYLMANLMAIAILSLANFFVSHLLIFQCFRSPVGTSSEDGQGFLGLDSLLPAKVTLPWRRHQQ